METSHKKAKKDGKFDTHRPYKLAHQTLCVRAINFRQRSIFGYVELTIHPLQTDLRRVKINSKQCKIFHVSVNDQWEARFLYNDPTLEICQEDGKQRNLDFFQNCHLKCMLAVDPDQGNGEVTIKLPNEVFPMIADLRPIKLCIEFAVEQPKGGIHFVVPNIEGTLAEKAAHMFTYRHENSSRLWFPCIDTYSEPCTWKIEITCDLNMTAVSCGELIETIYTSDRRSKTFHYFLSMPTAAPNIAMAVGPFEVVVDPNMHEVTHFCLPHLTDLLKHTTSYIHEAFEFYEELLSSRNPYSCYKQVFVDESYEDCMPYATMTIFSTNLLHSPRIIDQTLETRRTLAAAVAEQFFGCFITMQSCSDMWITRGVAGYLTNLFVKKTFGNNEYRYQINRDLKEVQEYENRVGGILLDPSSKDCNHHFSIRNPHTLSPKYIEVFSKKAYLVIRMLEIRIGAQLLIQVFNKILSLAYSASQQKFAANTWNNMCVSTNSCLKLISTVTGKDIQPFLDLWVTQSGCARFFGNSVFNRKRNVVELELKQDLGAKGSLKYVGPLTVTIQELDGSFNHTFKIEENKTKFDITCHSKSRRNKKKKIPLMTAEEVDMDLSAMDADSPVLWLRIDPDMHLLSQVTWEQPDFMWQYQLKFERDVVAQKEAIIALENYPTAATRKALTDTLENEHCFYLVRMEACLCLSKVANSMVNSWVGPPAMITIFRKLFGSHSCPNIVRQNNFTKLQHYYLLKTIPFAMAHLRSIQAICPQEVLHFILELFKYNDNSRNKYSDNYYRAALIDSLAATLTPAVTIMTGLGDGPTMDSLTSETKQILEEITRCLNLDKLLPCYHHTVTVSCLKAVRILQKFGHLPSDVSLFRSYMQYGVFRDVRIAAVEAVVDYIKTDCKPEELTNLIEVIEKDPDVYFRHIVIRKLVQNPPFKRGEHSHLHTQALVERLWKLMNITLSDDSRLRCDIADLYFTLYGRTRPTCLGIPESLVVFNLKEKKAKFNPSVVPLEMEAMFEEDEEEVDDVETENVAMEVEDGEIVDMTEPSVSVETDIPHGTKRRADSPLDLGPHTSLDRNPTLESSIIEASTEGGQSEDSNTSFKLKIKIGGASLDTAPSSLPSVKEELHPPPTPSSAQVSTFNSEFFKFVGMKQEEDSVSKMSSIPPPQTAGSVSMDTIGRLSEDSSSPIHYSSDTKGGSKPPMSFAGLLPGSQTSGGEVSMQSNPEDPSSSGKSHKSKKKKKKNKHKHKHKHKHDKSDRDRESSDRPKDAGGQYSSETSTVNSPIVKLDPPSSPEFEII